MYRKMLKSKIHRARVTEANLQYEGSITIPPSLLRAADILVNEAVNVWNITKGTRFETYAIRGKTDQDVCVNGAAAHLVDVNDLVIIATFSQILEEQCALWTPKVIFVDECNRLKEIRPEKLGAYTI